jgi:hypothetical protein
MPKSPKPMSLTASPIMLKSVCRWALLGAVLTAGVAMSRPSLAWAADAARLFKEGTAEGGELKFVGEVPVLFLQGEPEQMGRQQAALVFEVARRHAGLPKLVLAKYGAGQDWPLVVRASNRLMQAAPERHQRELQAALAKADYPRADREALVVANTLVELRRFRRCSAFVAEPPRSAVGEVLFGRNFDVPTFGSLDRLLLVAIYRPAKLHGFASVTWPGFIGVLSGMNDAGLALACLDSGPAKDGSPSLAPGGPLALAFRSILEECASVDEAEKLLRRTKATTWMNLTVCDRQRAVVFEITPKTVAVRQAENDLLACTNHFRTPELSVSQSCWRYRTLQRQWQRTQPFTWRDVASALHAVNLGQDTTQSMVFEPKSLRLRLASGTPPASSGPFVALELGELFRHKVAVEAK